jgi:hypothetical protein
MNTTSSPGSTTVLSATARPPKFPFVMNTSSGSNGMPNRSRNDAATVRTDERSFIL